ncbi:hypothetical protein K7432_009536 [Basidiobolus ranarum]|uniref:Uncharacterized protein n=1 Tax=Basidiobolus ranarum TaxID=34480 RepID=A0ABR2VXA8_9FUNG
MESDKDFDFASGALKSDTPDSFRPKNTLASEQMVPTTDTNTLLQGQSSIHSAINEPDLATEEHAHIINPIEQNSGMMKTASFHQQNNITMSDIADDQHPHNPIMSKVKDFFKNL